MPGERTGQIGCHTFWRHFGVPLFFLTVALFFPLPGRGTLRSAAMSVAGEASLLYLFEDYCSRHDRRELRQGSTAIELEPQVFDLLAYLIDNRERVVSKEDLIASVWQGRIVSESALSSRINAVRCAIGDSGEQQRLIRPFRARASGSWVRRAKNRHPAARSPSAVAEETKSNWLFRTSHRLLSFRSPI